MPSGVPRDQLLLLTSVCSATSGMWQEAGKGQSPHAFMRAHQGAGTRINPTQAPAREADRGRQGSF